MFALKHIWRKKTKPTDLHLFTQSLNRSSPFLFIAPHRLPERKCQRHRWSFLPRTAQREQLLFFPNPVRPASLWGSRGSARLWSAPCHPAKGSEQCRGEPSLFFSPQRGKKFLRKVWGLWRNKSPNKKEEIKKKKKMLFNSLMFSFKAAVRR